VALAGFLGAQDLPLRACWRSSVPVTHRDVLLPSQLPILASRCRAAVSTLRPTRQAGRAAGCRCCPALDLDV